MPGLHYGYCTFAMNTLNGKCLDYITNNKNVQWFVDGNKIIFWGIMYSPL